MRQKLAIKQLERVDHWVAAISPFVSQAIAKDGALVASAAAIYVAAIAAKADRIERSRFLEMVADCFDDADRALGKG